MKVRSFGCSFIYGSELSDVPDRSGFLDYSEKTWPALIAKELNATYACHARPGIGNLCILEKILTYANDSESSLFIIGWSWIDRFDYVTNQPNGDVELLGCNTWQTIRPGNTTKLSTEYYRQLHHQYRDKLVSLTYIKSAIDTLLQKQCPFIMTSIDDLLTETTWHSSRAVTELQNYINPYITKFDGGNFLDWSRRHQFPIGTRLHPLDEAHRAAASFILKDINSHIQNQRLV